MVYSEFDRDRLLISYINDDGGISLKKINLPDNQMYNLKYVEPRRERLEGLRSYDNMAVTKVRSLNLTSFRQFEILHQLSDSIKSQIFNMKMPRLHSVDIETEVLTSAIPSRDNPIEKVLTTALTDYDNKGGFTVHLYSIKKLTNTQMDGIQARLDKYIPWVKYKCIFKNFDSEKSMLQEIFQRFKEYPAITGWNFIKFDYDYLKARAIHLGLKRDVMAVSPTGTEYGFYIQDKFANKKSNKRAGVTVSLPTHKVIFDYMALFETKDQTIKPKESSTLGWVAQRVLGVSKVNYNGSLMELYEKDFETYCFYNIVDAILVLEIDKKIKTFTNLWKLGNLGKVPFHEGNFAGTVIQSLFIEAYLKRNQHFVERRQLPPDTYDGAFVKQPEPGRYDWVVGMDFESLYPNAIYSGNIGHDTYIGMQSESDKTKFRNERTTELEPIDLNKMTHTKTGAIFTKEFKSVPVEVMEMLFNERLVAKTTAQQIENEVAELEKWL